MKKILSLLSILLIASVLQAVEKDYTKYVNPFIGTTNYGTTNPGAVCPNGLMSVTPFNVMGSSLNKHDKDAGWWSTPYSAENSYFTGFSHVNLSGVGCPELSTLLLMPTTGALEVDYKKYGSQYNQERAETGYYTNFLTKYGIKTEVTATPRSSIERFTFPKGQGNILLNLGEGLTNKLGASCKWVSDTEVEGMRMLGGFCYDEESIFPLYFVMRFNKKPIKNGFWQKQPELGAEKAWDKYSGKYRVYQNYKRELSGDEIGAYGSFHFQDGETLEVQIGVSMVSTANARLNLDAEQKGFAFEKVKKDAKNEWQKELSKIEVEGGTDDQKTVFYTALYHTLIHPNILNDVNGEYPEMESAKIGKTATNRYTVYSLWDTYRNVHQLLTLAYPQKQLDMVRSMVDMYKESGWLPRWELYSQETLTMEGDPAFPVIVDTWMKGLRNFDVKTAYEAMKKSATLPSSQNFIRKDNDDYLNKGFVPLREKYDNSVSHALEYYIADNALSKLARKLGDSDAAERFYNQSMNYKKYYSKEFGTFRPLLPNGEFLKDFNPVLGMNFEPNPGFHEGSAWNYTFMVPFDVDGMVKLHGGKKNFVKSLQNVFDKGYYDPTNEPNIAYPYLFSYIKGEAWRTQKLVKELLAKYFKNSVDGLPGNDDTGTMSTWAVFSMMGIYPADATSPDYIITTPLFDKITIHLDKTIYNSDKIVIEKEGTKDFIKRIKLDNKKLKGFLISHEQLIKTKKLTIECR